MKSFSEILQNTFGSAPLPEPAPVAPPSEPAPPAPETPRGKSMGDPQIAAEAQRIYNPNMPPAPPKALASPGEGTVSTLDVSGTWGAPEAKS